MVVHELLFAIILPAAQEPEPTLPDSSPASSILNWKMRRNVS